MNRIIVIVIITITTVRGFNFNLRTLLVLFWIIKTRKSNLRSEQQVEQPMRTSNGNINPHIGTSLLSLLYYLVLNFFNRSDQIPNVEYNWLVDVCGLACHACSVIRTYQLTGNDARGSVFNIPRYTPIDVYMYCRLLQLIFRCSQLSSNISMLVFNIWMFFSDVTLKIYKYTTRENLQPPDFTTN